MNNFGPVVTAEWLADHLGESDLAVVDCRWYLDGRSGRDAYENGHIPSAVWADIDADLAAPASTEGGRHPLPDPIDFASSMSRLGIGDNTRVIAYDDVGGVIAGRLWWMLDVLGHEAAILDGGIAAWAGPLADAPVAPVPAPFAVTAWPNDRIMTKAQVADALGSDLTIIDARSADRFANGGPVDPRPGHVPGASSAPATDNLANGRLRPAEELAAHYKSMGAEAGDVVAYCGSGVSACIDLLAMRHAGLDDGKLFVGSWSAWGADLSLPNEVGDGG
jgi:thiosulfate/3-mercaptopyruvate sulfurtransferase